MSRLFTSIIKIIWRYHSEAVNGRTDNTIVKLIKTERQTMIYKTLHRQLNIEQHHKNRGELRYSRRVNISSSTSGTYYSCYKFIKSGSHSWRWQWTPMTLPFLFKQYIIIVLLLFIMFYNCYTTNLPFYCCCLLVNLQYLEKTTCLLF